MNFMEAMEAATAGKKVRGKYWKEDRYVTWTRGQFFDRHGKYATFTHSPNTEWEIYEEIKPKQTYWRRKWVNHGQSISAGLQFRPTKEEFDELWGDLECSEEWRSIEV